jgi:hypothetical protein
MPKSPGGRSRAHAAVAIGSLTVAASAFAWWLTRDPERNDLSDAVTICVGILALAVTVMQLRQSKHDARPGFTPEEQLESLAVLMHESAANEKRTLKLTGSDYIQVEWQVDTAAVPGRVTQTLDGDIASIGSDWLRHRPRLTVILGSKGAGKSAAALLLTHQLLELRNSGATKVPVPVLLHIGGWDPEAPFLEWVAQQLAAQYGLQQPRSPEGVDITAHLARGGDIMLVLDGFDEIAEPFRANAFVGLQHALDTSTAPIVVTSRPDEFMSARAASGLRVEGWSIVVLRPISPEQARAYLEKDHDPGNWTAVFDEFDREHSPVAQALSTPLMVFLCREVYQHQRPDRATFANFDSREAVEQHLVAHFLPAVYGGQEVEPDRSERESEQAERYLRFIATHMKQTAFSTFGWWQLHRSSRFVIVRLMFALAAGLTTGLTIGLAFGLTGGLAVGLAAGLTVGLAVGLAVGLMGRQNSGDFFDPVYLALNRRHLGQGLMVGLTIGLAAGLTVGLTTGLMAGLTAGLTIGLAFGLTVGLTFGPMASQTSTQLKVLSSRDVFINERKATNLIGLAFGMAFGLMAGLMAGLTAGPTDGLTGGLAFGLAAGLTTKLISGASSMFYRLSHLSLAFPYGRKLPWSLMAFLEDAHRRGVLRQVGATYEFRHAALQTYLTEPVLSPSSGG